MDKTNESKVITMELQKALGILAGAILVAAVGGATVAYSTLNSDHFLLATVHAQVDQNTKDLQNREQVISDFRVAQNDIQQIKQDIQQIKQNQIYETNTLNKILGELGDK